MTGAVSVRLFFFEGVDKEKGVPVFMVCKNRCFPVLCVCFVCAHGGHDQESLSSTRVSNSRSASPEDGMVSYPEAPHDPNMEHVGFLY